MFCLSSASLLHKDNSSVPADSAPLLYVVQQQPLGSVQWSVVASSLRETNYTVTGLSKGVRYAFRVLASTGKMCSKPSPSTDLVQLLDRGEEATDAFWTLSRRRFLNDNLSRVLGPYLRKAPVIMDKPDMVYVVENQPVSITVSLNHVHAVVTWKRLTSPQLL